MYVTLVMTDEANIIMLCTKRCELIYFAVQCIQSQDFFFSHDKITFNNFSSGLEEKREPENSHCVFAIVKKNFQNQKRFKNI